MFPYSNQHMQPRQSRLKAIASAISSGEVVYRKAMLSMRRAILYV